MKRLITSILILIILSPINIIAQGIKFQDTLILTKVINLAKKENKYIFVDIYATWCIPCKMMDKQVYINDTIGHYYNENFISIKLQMNKTKNDNLLTQKCYKTADSIQKAYNITSYPSYLFLASDGTLALMDVGYYNVDKFLTLGKLAMDKENNYAGLDAKFKSGRLTIQETKRLAYMALKLNNLRLSEQVIKISKDHLNKQNKNDLFTKENFDFIRIFSNAFSINDNLVQLIYNNKSSADSIMHEDGFSNQITDYIITKDIVFPFTGEKPNTRLGVNNNPDKSEPIWRTIQDSISRKFDINTSNRILLNSKIRWFTYKKNWEKVVNLCIQKTQTTKMDTSALGRIYLNNMIYSIIFKHSEDSKALEKGIQWIEEILKFSPNDHSYLDTYANLLYKIGMVKKSIKIEEQALGIAQKLKNKSEALKISAVLANMKDGKPTWDGH